MEIEPSPPAPPDSRPPWHRQPWLFGASVGVFLAVLLVLAGRFLPPRTATQDTRPWSLAYGLYWKSYDDQTLKAEPGVPNPYYDPHRPTLIYVHGWQPETRGRRESLVWQHNDFEADLAAPWLDAGWNVGVFYWDQFADEPLVMDAEAKIWTTTGGAGMRYRLPSGRYVRRDVDRSVGGLLYESYTAVLADYTGDEIRLVGHSMGNQLVVQLSEQVVTAVSAGELNPRLAPQRVILADPYWSLGERDFLGGQSVGQRVREAIVNELIPRGVLVEWYRSSYLTGAVTSDVNTELIPHVLFAEMRPYFCHSFDQVCRHEASWHQYLLSYGTEPPPECAAEPKGLLAPCVATGRRVLLARQSADEVAARMAEPAVWVQVAGPTHTAVDGRFTPPVADDWYERL
ncbi:MAG: hypothetical protein KDD89_14905, partial [Anaerolineales bacterium]|nr:hypothetical protein [Anaerolineales bacterium]